MSPCNKDFPLLCANAVQKSSRTSKKLEPQKMKMLVDISSPFLYIRSSPWSSEGMNASTVSSAWQRGTTSAPFVTEQLSMSSATCPIGDRRLQSPASLRQTKLESPPPHEPRPQSEKDRILRNEARQLVVCAALLLSPTNFFPKDSQKKMNRINPNGAFRQKK